MIVAACYPFAEEGTSNGANKSVYSSFLLAEPAAKLGHVPAQPFRFHFGRNGAAFGLGTRLGLLLGASIRSGTRLGFLPGAPLRLGAGLGFLPGALLSLLARFTCGWQPPLGLGIP